MGVYSRVVSVSRSSEVCPYPVIVIVDNRDSFTWNLVHAFAHAGAEVRVIEADATSAEDVLALAPAALVLSPGPGRPEQAQVCMALISKAPAVLPVFGVCLGHQVLCAALGAHVSHAHEPMHGRTSRITHDGRGLFLDLPQGFRVARYHSLAVDAQSLPAELAPTAFADDGTLMAVQHRARPWFSVQFHPESYLTDFGRELVARFVRHIAHDGLLRPGAIPRVR